MCAEAGADKAKLFGGTLFHMEPSAVLVPARCSTWNLRGVARTGSVPRGTLTGLEMWRFRPPRVVPKPPEASNSPSVTRRNPGAH